MSDTPVSKRTRQEQSSRDTDAPQSHASDAGASWSMRRLFRALAHAIHEFHEHDLFTSAAAMSYFGLLTLFPMLFVLLAVSNRLATVNEFVRRIIATYPGSSEFLHTTLRSLADFRASVVVTCLVVMLWAGSWIFAVMERAINRIWATRHRAFLHGRALTLVMFATVGVFLMVSVVLTSFLVALREMTSHMSLRALQRMPLFVFVGDAVWQIVFATASIVITIVLFTLVYRFIPNCKVRLRYCLPSAIFAGLLWEAAKYIFAWSLQYLNYGEIYGSVGAVVAVMTWSYVSSLILLFGAQLSKSIDSFFN
ncbi:MAG: YihY/virulence factor BrkB family protein [Pyrinomonadaceae bacterium]